MNAEPTTEHTDKQQFVYMSGTEIAEQVREAYQPVWLVAGFALLIAVMSVWGLFLITPQ